MDSNIDYNFYFKNLLSNMYKADVIILEPINYDKIGFIHLNSSEIKVLDINSFHTLSGSLVGSATISINTDGVIDVSSLSDTIVDLKYPKLNTQIITITLSVNSMFSGIINK